MVRRHTWPHQQREKHVATFTGIIHPGTAAEGINSNELLAVRPPFILFQAVSDTKLELFQPEGPNSPSEGSTEGSFLIFNWSILQMDVMGVK
jgi:hypothetical protein